MKQKDVDSVETIASIIAKEDVEKTLLKELFSAHFQGHLCLEKKEKIDGINIECIDEQTKWFGSLVGRWGSLYYLQRSYVLETKIFDLLQEIMNRSVKPLDIQNIQPLNHAQIAGVKKALRVPFCALTGGPGTGKTHTIVSIMYSFLKGSDEEVVVLAPTGKAASVLKKRIFNDSADHFAPFLKRIQVATIHKYFSLHAFRDPACFSKLLRSKLCIIDEASMIDTDIWVAILSAVTEGTRLLVCGDPYQLPPVEIGSLFSEICSALIKFKPDCFAKLTQSMRTDNKAIIESAEIIKEGQLKKRLPFETEVDWESVMQQLPAPFSGAVSDGIIKALFAKLASFRILTPLKKGPFGVAGINKRSLEFMSDQFKEGEVWPIPIMVLKNEPSLNLANGDVGFVLHKTACLDTLKDNEIFFIQEGEVVSMPLYLLSSYEICFALSVHKSQGSEFDDVLLLLPPASENFGREIAYTGVTRAKKSVKIISEQSVIDAVLSTTGKRQSGLGLRFAKLYTS